MNAQVAERLHPATAVDVGHGRRARPQRVYVASSSKNETFHEVVRALRAAGHHAYDFRAQPTYFAWSDLTSTDTCSTVEQKAALAHPRAQRAFLADMLALLEADACVLVLPAGASSHVEFGFAVGAGKKAVVLLADGRPELMYAMGATVCASIEEVVRTLATPGRAR